MIPTSSVRSNARVLLLIKRATTSSPRTPSDIACRSLTNAASAQGYSRDDVLQLLNERQSLRNDMAYSVSFGDDRAFSLSSMVEPSALMQQQLQYSQDQLRRSSPQQQKPKIYKMDNSALPKTLEDVMRQKSRAIVVTETAKPFKVVDVNECWEDLCGYSFTEARGKTLGSLLKGPATNQVAATGLVAHLLAGEEAGAVLTNYTKEGREFRNRIRVGPLFDESDNITHFVGVLEEIKEHTQM
jgi:PAS domain S-box-containing protein